MLYPQHGDRIVTTDSVTSLHLIIRAFQFAIRIDSIRYTNRFEYIRFVKKIGLSIH